MNRTLFTIAAAVIAAVSYAQVPGILERHPANSPEGKIHDLGIPSLLQFRSYWEKLKPYCVPGAFLYVSGLLNDAFLQAMAAQPNRPDLIVSDFTKLFVSAPAYQAFVRGGSCLWVLQQPVILGVCVNPVSPDGYVLDSLELRERMSEALGREVYDILF